jgi:hypothetical protein
LALRDDEFVSRRKDICSAACDVVVRGGRGGPALLPTMLVGGFGEGTALASLRLSLAIAQNGAQTQHAKLALSGIMVPISDLLRNALSNGDLYKFSAALALVRFCGPHIASGESGGLQSVRDAIRIATNVLTLPIPHDASIEQIETQESLKAECISALESLSHNASLWNSISTDALPSMVRYLQSTGDASGGSARRRETRCAALRVFLQLVQVPSHAVSAAEAGLSQPLGKLFRNGKGARIQQEEEDDVPMLALEVLQVLAKNDESRRKARFLDTGVARDICYAIGNAATDKPKKPTDSRANITVVGLEVLHTILSDVESDINTRSVLQSSAAIAFLDAVASERHFVRAMCATLLLKTGMKLPVQDPEEDEELFFDVPKIYGPPLVLVREECAGFANTHEAVAAILFSVAVYACAIDSKRSEAFWNACLLKDGNSTADPSECSQTSATLVAHFLSLLDNDYKPFLPVDTERKEDFNLISRPLVRHHLLEALRVSINTATKFDEESRFLVSLFVKFNVPVTLLSLWSDPALLDLAFELLKQVVEIDPDDLLHLFVESKEAILAVFNMLNLDPPVGTSTDIVEIRRFLASVLGKLAENGLLANAVSRFDVRSSAIGALAAACLTEEEKSADEDDDEDMTSNRLSSGLMRCLVELCSVKVENEPNARIVLSSVEAEAIAKNLGKKICHMVLSRFLERAKLHQYEMEEDEVIMKAPDVAMLCAVAQHDSALQILRKIGGLHALSQIAAEGELSAVLVLKKVRLLYVIRSAVPQPFSSSSHFHLYFQACEDDFSLLLEADTFSSIMTLFSKEDHIAHWRSEPLLRCQLERAAFELLSQLCHASQRGRKAVAASESCNDCTARALAILVKIESNAENDEDSDAGELVTEMPNKLDPSESAQLEAAALSFLSSLVPVPAVCKELVNNDDFIKATSAMVSCEHRLALQHEAVKLMKSLAPYASKQQTLTPELIASVLHQVLESEPDVKAPTEASVNSNMFYATAISGILIVFSCLPGETQLNLAKAVSTLFSKTVKSVTVARGDRLHAGQLVYNLTTIMLLARGKDSTEEIFSGQLMTSLAHLIQWRYDPKTRLDDAEAPLWNAAVTHCVQILSLTLMTTEELLASAGVKISELGKTALMVARPGKAPRKALDFASSLKKLIETGDAAGSVAAQHVMNQLF